MNIEEASTLLAALADKSRLTIVKTLLKNKKMIANDLLSYVDCKQATLSHHMQELVDVELVNAKKDGNKTFYSANKGKVSQLSNFLAVKPEEAVKASEFVVEEHVKVIKPVEQENPRLIVPEYVEKEVKRKGDPVSISVPIYLL